MKKTILFVDDEENILQGLRRMLHTMRAEWEMAFAPGGQEALDLMIQKPFDVVVSDMRMPEMDGAQLLAEVARLYPGTVRIVLSGQSDREKIMKVVGAAHQYLAKPCDTEVLRTTIARACALRELLANDILKRIATEVGTLPSLPVIYNQIMKKLQQPDASLTDIGQIIGKDIAMSAKILQLVNSAFFGVKRKIANVPQAVNLLGLDTLKALILSTHVFTQFNPQQMRSFCLDSLQHHSMLTGAIAKAIMKEQGGDRLLMEEAFMAGILHETGMLVLASRLPDQYQTVFTQASERKIPICIPEKEMFGITHAEVGAFLLGLWGLPDGITEAVAYHHQPERCINKKVTPLMGVHVADCLATQLCPTDAGGIIGHIQIEYLEAIGLTNRLDIWKSIGQDLLNDEEIHE